MSPCCQKHITQSTLWRWLIVFSTGLVFSVNAGFYKTQSLFLEQLLTVYGESVTRTAFVLSLESTVRFMSSPLVSVLCERFGYRKTAICGGFICCLGFALTGCAPSLSWTYITFGILTGFGTSMFAVVRLSIVNMFFRKHRGKVNAASYVLFALGGIYMAQLIPALFSNYGFFGGCLLIGGLTLHLVPVGALLHPTFEDTEIANKSMPVEKSALPEAECAGNAEKCEENERPRVGPIDKKMNTTLSASSKRKYPYLWFKLMAQNMGITLLVDPNMLVFCVFLSGLFYSSMSSSAFIAGSFLERGFTIAQVTLLLSTTAGFEIGARVVSGFICDIPRLRPLRGLMLGGTALVSGFAGFFLHAPNTIGFAMVLFIVHQIGTGLARCQWPTVMSDIVLPSHITRGVGICQFFCGLGLLLGPVIGGYIRDVRKSYKIVFQVAGAQLILFSICLIIVFILSLRKRLNEILDTDSQEGTVGGNIGQPPMQVNGAEGIRKDTI